MTDPLDAHLADIQARAIALSGERDLKLLPVILRETLDGMQSQPTREGRMWARIPRNLVARILGVFERQAGQIATLTEQLGESMQFWGMEVSRREQAESERDGWAANAMQYATAEQRVAQSESEAASLRAAIQRVRELSGAWKREGVAPDFWIELNKALTEREAPNGGEV